MPLPPSPGQRRLAATASGYIEQLSFSHNVSEHPKHAPVLPCLCAIHA